MRKIYFLLLAYALIGNVWAQKRFTLSGYVVEQGSQENLPQVTVYAPALQVGTTTNNYGFYSLSLPADSVEVLFSYTGYKTVRQRFVMRKDTIVSIVLEAAATDLQEIVLSEGEEKASETPQMSTLSLSRQQVKDAPALLGEKDVLRVLQLMPGVKSAGEGNAGLYVRGGGADQNLIILDDATVYNVSHLFGFFSLFNGNAIKSVELTKGGFPARYGGRLSSVLDMTMKDGNKEKLAGEGSLGLISASLTLEAPIQKGKSSFLISARRTYLDLLVYPLLPADQKMGYFFYDLNAKANYTFSHRDKLYISGYFGKDKFWLSDKTTSIKLGAELYWGNAASTLRWNHLFSEKVFSNLSLIFSHYNFVMGASQEDDGGEFNLTYYSRIRDFSAKYDVDFSPSPQHSLKAGILLTTHRFTPSATVVKDDRAGLDLTTKQSLDAGEGGIYIEDVFRPNARLSMNVGIRLSYFGYQNTHYVNPEPRLSLACRVREDWAIKASYALMNQYIHLLSNTGTGLPTDLWIQSTDRVKPQQSQQIALGFAKDFENPKLALTVEGYYKESKRVVSYKDGATFIVAGTKDDPDYIDWQDNVTQGRGWSYGAEVFLQKKAGKVTGWVGYTLSWAQMQFDNLNLGRKFFARYDRRHDVSLVGVYKPNDKITLSAVWVYGTGNAISLPLGRYNLPAHDLLNTNNGTPQSLLPANDYGEKNSFRMRDTHRLDVSVQFHKKKSWGERVWELSVYNAYNRKNPYFYYLSDDVDGAKLKQVSLFGLLPSVAYRFKF